MNSKFSLRQFKRTYGTHVLCLEAIKQRRFPEGTHCPKCTQETAFYPVHGRSAYACKLCGWHVYPLAGTIFEHSSTPLDLWFFAMYLMTQTRSGTSAKQLERMVGVTYKTAWRMFKQIRMLMAQSGVPLDGTVEIDETFIGGKAKNRAYVPNFNEKAKEVVMGMVKRGGHAYLKHIEGVGKWILLRQIQEHVSPTARVLTDEWGGYSQLSRYGYSHAFVNHSASQYVHGDIHTQNIEGIWSIVKRGVYGVYRIVSKKYLQAYVDEYTFRYNHRKNGRMFDILLDQVIAVRIVPVSQLS
ncbi:MAG: IS1595 family transposase [Candidatus Gottesmanbacteria bacterium]|nr:IS1595 family transposase [Candidatus Gottesmanbacteria bacterium]